MPPKFYNNQEGMLFFTNKDGRIAKLEGFTLDNLDIEPLSADENVRMNVGLINRDRSLSMEFFLDSETSLLTMAKVLGLPVVVVTKASVCDVIGYERAKRHRKKRIDKKWLKRYGYKPIYGPENNYIFDKTLYVGPDSYKEIKGELE